MVGNTDPMQSEVGKQSKNCVDNIGSTLLVAVNEPSQALYRIQVRVEVKVHTGNWGIIHSDG